MRHTFALVCLLLLWPSVAWGQIPNAIRIGERLSPAKVKEIEQRHQADGDLLQRLKESTAVQLEVGEFDIFQALDDQGKPVDVGPVLWLSIDAGIASKIDVVAGERFSIYGKRKGEAAPRWHVFPPQPFPYWTLAAEKQGASPVVLIKNGADATKPPSVVDRFDLTVGRGPKPPDPPAPPPDDAFTKTLRDALAKDTAAGKGSKAHVQLLADTYRGAVIGGIPNGTLSNVLGTAQRVATGLGLPPASQSLTSLRNAIADFLDQRLGTEDRQVTLEDKNRTTAAFSTLADVLEVLAK